MLSNNIYTILSSLPHNNHHLKRYIKFIEKYSNTHTEEYTENHHICPKALFPKFANLKKNPWNSSILTGRQHFIAHIMLAKIYGGSMIYCLYRLTKQCDIQVTPSQYDFIKRTASSYRSKNSKNRKWWHNPKTNQTIFQENTNSNDYILGRNVTYNKNKLGYYNINTLEMIYLEENETPPENFIKGSPKSLQNLWYDTKSGKAKYFNKNITLPTNYIKGSPESASWRYKNIETNEILYSKENNLHLTSNNIILYPILKDKKCYYDPDTLQMKYFSEDEAPVGWINKNIKQIGVSRTKGTKWYHNAQGKSKMFSPNNVPEGWYVGRK